MEPNPEQVRWRWVTREIPPEKAQARRDDEIRHLRNQIDELHDELAALLNKPLPTESRMCEAVRPGEPGWEEADILLDPAGYGGEFRWVGDGFVRKEDQP